LLGSSSQAAEVVRALWNLFGTGSELHSSLRPFGQVIIDRFDFGILLSLNENNKPEYYVDLVLSLCGTTVPPP
jgi:hypothetical protein